MSKRRKQLYGEMDDFIGFLRKKDDTGSRFSIFDKLKRRKKEKIERKPEFSEIKEISESEEPKMQEVSEEVEKEEKKGFMSVMSNMFRKKEKVEEDISEEAVKLELYKTEMESDAKKALEIADGLIKKIPNFELRKFMQSEDYEKYESVMKKYGLR